MCISEGGKERGSETFCYGYCLNVMCIFMIVSYVCILYIYIYCKVQKRKREKRKE